MERKCSSIYQMSLRTITSKGTINAAKELLSYVAELGFEYVYILPVCEADRDMDKTTWSQRMMNCGLNNPANPYKLIDFFKVDSEYGTNEDLKNFIEIAHNYGLKIMLDLVYLHCGRNIYHSKDDPDFLVRDENGNIPCGNNWPFARINFKNENAREYLWSNMLYWALEYKADGFRCDCGDMVPIDFWEEGIRRVREINPNFFMLNEGYNRETLNHGFDLIYTDNEMITEPNLFYMIKGKISVDEWKKRTEDEFVKSGKFIRFVENHDMANDTADFRLEKEIGNKKMEAYIALCYTLNGVPFVWNGNEICDTSVNCLLGNAQYGSNSIDWKKMQTLKGKRRLEVIKTLNKLRYDYPEMQNTPIHFIDSENNTIHFERHLNNDGLTAFFNFDNSECIIKNKPNMKILISNGINVSEKEIIIEPNGYFVARYR